MAASKKEMESWGRPIPTLNFVPNPIMTGQFQPLHPMAGIYYPHAVPQSGQPDYGLAPPTGMLVTSKEHYDALVGTEAMNPLYQSQMVPAFLKRKSEPMKTPGGTPTGWHEYFDIREPQGRIRIIYYDDVTKISTYDAPKARGERAYVGVYGPPQIPKLAPVGPYTYIYITLGPEPQSSVAGPYELAQYTGPFFTPQPIKTQAHAANLQPPSQPVAGSWVNPKILENQAFSRDRNPADAVPHAQGKPAGHVPVNGAKKKKGVVLLDDGISTCVEATDYQGNKELRVARPPANRAAARYVGFAFNEGSVTTANSNSHEEREDADRTPRPSDFKPKKVEASRINVSEPQHVVPAVITQGYKPGLHYEIQDRLDAMMMSTSKAQTYLLPNEAAQLAVQTLKAEIEAELRDPNKQGKEQRQRNMDLLKVLDFSEGEKFMGQYAPRAIPGDLLYKRGPKPEMHEEKIIRAHQVKEVKQAKHEKQNQQNQRPMGAFSYKMLNDDKKTALNLKHAQSGDLYHLKDAPQSSQTASRTPLANYESPPNGIYTQVNQLKPIPMRGEVEGPRMVLYNQHSINSATESFEKPHNTGAAEAFATGAPEDDIFGLSPPPPPPPVARPQPAAKAKIFDEPAISKVWTTSGAAYGRVPKKVDSAEAMIKAQIVASAKKAARSYKHASAASLDSTGSDFSDDLFIGQASEEGKKPSTMPSTATAVFMGAVTGRNVSNVLVKPQTSDGGKRSSGLQGGLTVGGHATQRRSSTVKFSDDVKRPPELSRGLTVGGYATQRRSSAVRFENENRSDNVMLKAPEQPALRKQPSLLFMTGGIADALSAAESIKSEHGLWKPVNQLPLAISNRAHYVSDADDDSFDTTSIQYNRGGGVFGRTTKHNKGFAQTQTVSKGYKASEESGGQQTSASEPDLNNYYEITDGLGNKSFINVATGKEFENKPANGIVVPIPRVTVEGEEVTNEAVDTFVAKYTEHVKNYKTREAERETQKAKLQKKRHTEEEMSFLTACGPLAGGWKAVSDNGHNQYTSQNFGTLVGGSATRIPPQAGRADPPRYNPSVHPSTGATRPVHQHLGYLSGVHTHHNPHGSHMIYNNPYGQGVPYGQSTQYNRFGAQQQQWGYQNHFTGPYGNGMVGSAGFGQGTYYQGGCQSTHHNNMGGGGGGQGAGYGGQYFQNYGNTVPYTPNCTIRLPNNGRNFSNPHQ